MPTKRRHSPPSASAKACRNPRSSAVFCAPKTGLFLPVADVDRPAIEGLQEQLRKIGGNLNQAVRAMNAGRVGYEPALAKSLAALLGMMQPMNKRLAAMARPARARRSPDQ